MSKATDVWSLGVMLYETLTAGETPYKECSKNKQVAEKVGGWESEGSRGWVAEGASEKGGRSGRWRERASE